MNKNSFTFTNILITICKIGIVFTLTACSICNEMTVREGIHVIALSYFVWDLTKDRDSFQEKIERIERLEAEYEALVKERERFEELHKKL